MTNLDFIFVVFADSLTDDPDVVNFITPARQSLAPIQQKIGFILSSCSAATMLLGQRFIMTSRIALNLRLMSFLDWSFYALR